MPVNTEDQRLRALYAEMSDERLLELAEQKAGLTDDARLALAAEMADRGLVEHEEEAGTEPAPGPAEDDGSLVEVMTFQIAGDAEQALRFLDEAGVPVRMEAAMRRIVEGGPLVRTNWLTLSVERERQQQAVKVLREKMGLFPVLAPEEMDGGDEGQVEDEALFLVGEFDLNADVEVVRKALTAAGIWFKETKVAEAEMTITLVESRLDDLEAALAAVEAAFGEG